MHKILLLNLLIVNTLIAQKVSVSKVNDNRSTSESSFFSQCEVELKITGDELRRYKYLKLATLDKATDNQDFDLLKDNSGSTDYTEIDDFTKVTVKLRNPSRKATVLAELSGQIRLYNPTLANGAIIKIPNYNAKTNVNLLPNTIGLKLIYLTKSSIDKLAAEQKKKNEAELKKLTEAERKLAEGLLELADSFGGFDTDEKSVSFILEGDASKLVDVYFEDEKGKKIERNGRMTSNEKHTFYFKDKPQPKWTMMLLVETEKSVSNLPFSLKSIDLP
jgi:hypothetical protein